MDYFKKLGINAIWITAPYEQAHGWVSGKDKKFPHYAFHGYYTLDWTFMDRNMGTIDEFRKFVQTCHENGIRVIMDIVMNHVGYNNRQDMITYNYGNKTSHADGWLAKVGGVWDANDSINESDWKKFLSNLDINEILNVTSNKNEGIGGIDTKGVARKIY
mgnify:CR=1 FL=1